MKHKCFLSETRDYVCEVCNKAFTGKYALAVHVKIHGERKELSCDYCPKTCFNITKLKEHLKRMHPGKPAPDGTIPKTRMPAERKFKCEYCDEKAYTSKAALEYHMNGVHPDKFDTTTQHYFKCESCGKTLTGRQSYDRHLKTHNAERTLQCRLCDKKFATRNCRAIHEKLHDKVGRFECEVCGKKFPIKAYLRRHEKTHASEDQDQFQCATCGQLFVTHSRLQIHLETHASTRMYECEMCESAFSEVARLRRHMRNKHGIRRRGMLQEGTCK
ncbi:zinc finger protein 26 [Nilaparvata lugens]|uniref:zinc finger protein 26 n=1 Tax=Nilaparvata lugens TaxID=108931 RepID=UPI00193D8148|nr:zinc finger protein 26 [Nilaparvata lugens]